MGSLHIVIRTAGEPTWNKRQRNEGATLKAKLNRNRTNWYLTSFPDNAEHLIANTCPLIDKDSSSDDVWAIRNSTGAQRRGNFILFSI
jgi:hypothetical protein